MSLRGKSPPPQPVSIFRPRPFPPSATTTPSVEYNPLPRPALTTITTSQATAPPQPVSSTYQPTGRRNPSHENPHLAGPPPVLQVPYVTPPMSLSDVPQPALGMFQPIPIPPPQPPPLLTVTDGQLSMVYIPSGTSFSTIAPGTRVVTDPDHPELHHGCFSSFEKETFVLNLARLNTTNLKLGRELNEKTLELNDNVKKYNQLNGWYTSIKKEIRDLDNDYQSLKKEVLRSREKCADADNDVKHYREECKDLSKQLADSKMYRKNLSESVTRANASARAAVNREMLGHNVIKSKDSVIQQKELEIKAIKQEMDSLKQQVVLLNEQIKSLKETNDLASQAALMDSKTSEEQQKKIKELSEVAMEKLKSMKDTSDPKRGSTSPFPPSPSSPPPPPPPPSHPRPVASVGLSSPSPRPRSVTPPPTIIAPSVPLSAPYPLVVAGPTPLPLPSLPMPPSPPPAVSETPITETTAMTEKDKTDEPVQSMCDDALPIPLSADIAAPVIAPRTRRRRKTIYGPIRNKKKRVAPY